MHAATTGAITGCYNSGAAAAGMVGTLNGAAVSSCVNTGTVTNAIANTNTADNYYLEGSAVNANGASVKTSAELKALGLNGFELKDGYEYPLPAGISYNPPASGN